MKYLDTSIPLCVFTEQPERYIENSEKIMGDLERGSILAITSVLTLIEIYHILKDREKYARGNVKDAILSLLDCAGLQIVDAKAELAREVIELATAYEIDLVDAYNYLTMKKHNLNEIYSLDAHYDKFNDIKRLF